MTDRALRPERQRLLDQAQALMQDGTFASDADRTSFDALLDQVDELDEALR